MPGVPGPLRAPRCVPGAPEGSRAPEGTSLCARVTPELAPLSLWARLVQPAPWHKGAAGSRSLLQCELRLLVRKTVHRAVEWVVVEATLKII